MGPWSKGRKTSTSYPDGENIHHVEDVKCISESQRQRKKEVAPEALQVAERIQRKKEASSVDVLLMLCASITWAQVGDRWWAGWAAGAGMVEHCGAAAHTARQLLPFPTAGTHGSRLLSWAGLHCTKGQRAEEARTASASAGRRAGAVGSTSWPPGQKGLSWLGDPCCQGRTWYPVARQTEQQVLQ